MVSVPAKFPAWVCPRDVPEWGLGAWASARENFGSSQVCLDLVTDRDPVFVRHVLLKPSSALGSVQLDLEGMDFLLVRPFLCPGCTHLGVSEFDHIAFLLLDAGADVNSQVVDGRSALHAAARCGCVEIVQALVRVDKVDVNVVGNDGFTPLHVACGHGNLGVACILVQLGAGVNTPSLLGHTPLHVACSRGHLGMAEWLVGCGANTHLITKDGSSPEDVAREKNHTAIAKWLEQRENPCRPGSYGTLN